MANRFPLIANPSTNQIQELSNLDNLDLSGNSIVGVTTIFATNVSIAGTLTYEDVTNVDSIGIITARDGISITGGNVTLTGGGSFIGDGSTLTGLATTENVNAGSLNVAGVTTVGTGITLSPDGDGFFTGITTIRSASFGGGVLQESFHNDTSAVSGTHNHDALTYGMVWNGSTNAGGSFVINLRGDANTTFDSLIDIGKATTMTIYSANNSTSNYMTAFQIDGSVQTIKYANATTPSAATGSGVDVYSLTILKTAASTYSVFGNFTNFA